MKLFGKLGFVIIASFPILLTSCIKSNTENPDDYKEELEGIYEIGEKPIGSYKSVEYTKYTISERELSWKSDPSIKENYHAKILCTWSDVIQTFDINSENQDYFNIDFSNSSIIACMIYTPQCCSAIDAKLSKKSNSLNYYALHVDINHPYMEQATPDFRTILMITPKIPLNALLYQAYSHIKYSDQP